MSSAWRGCHSDRRKFPVQGGDVTVADTSSPTFTAAPPGAGSAKTDLLFGSANTELASSRTSLAFTRTVMAADRTLMATLRTALSLISFGFTIDQAFHQLNKSGVHVSEVPARNFGLGLILLGMAMLVMGLFGHRKFRRQLTERRDRLFSQGLLHTDLPYTATSTFVGSFLVLLLGLAAAIGIFVRMRLLT
jgi:putative membrane protein